MDGCDLCFHTQGSTEILFDLSDFGYGEYEVDHTVRRPVRRSWYYDNIFTVNETLDGFYWTTNPDDDDCEIDFTSTSKTGTASIHGYGYTTSIWMARASSQQYCR